MPESRFWSPYDILSRNGYFNFVVGGRGTGKTFGSLEFGIRRYVNKGRRFIYMRRYESEFDKKDRLLSAVSVKFPKHEFRVDGPRLQVREAGDDNKWQTMGYLTALSTAQTEKSIPYDDVDYIFFDEFIIDKGCIHYLRNEVECFLDYYNTVDRWNDRVRVLFLANSVSIVNPYYLYFGLSPRKDTQWQRRKKGYICLQQVRSQPFIDAVDATRFGQMIRGTDYYAYAVGNEYRDDDDTFIEPRPSSATFVMALTFDGSTLALFQDLTSGLYFVTDNVPKDAMPYALTTKDMRPNMLMLERTSRTMKACVKMHSLGLIRYDSVRVRAVWLDILNHLNVR